jgi:DNA polymerase III subunit epsilon
MRFGFEGQGCFPTGKHYPGIAHLLRIAASGVAEEFDSQSPLAEIPLISIDTETTGRDPRTDRAVEIACVVLLGGVIVEKQVWLVNPGRPIPQEAFEVHGISDDDVKDKPPFAEIVAELAAAMSGRVPVAYNAEFDRTVLLSELELSGAMPRKKPPAFRPGTAWLDPLVWARELYKEEKSRSLGAIAELVGVNLEKAHRATDDAAAAALVLVEFFKDKRVPSTYAAFVHEQQRLARLQGEERQYWRNP